MKQKLLKKLFYFYHREKSNYSVDSLKLFNPFKFINSNSIGQVDRELCIRYQADLSGTDKTFVTSAECLAAINYRNSSIKEYSFLGVQPMIVDNRIVMDLLVTRPDGTKSSITASDIRRMDNVESYFDFWEYIEVKQQHATLQSRLPTRKIFPNSSFFLRTKNRVTY